MQLLNDAKSRVRVTVLHSQTHAFRTAFRFRPIDHSKGSEIGYQPMPKAMCSGVPVEMVELWPATSS